MRFYKVTEYSDVNCSELYETLESIGDFIIDGSVILFYSKGIKKISKILNLGAKVEEIDALTYKSDKKLSNEWLNENYRKFRVEKLLKKAEQEKQEDLSKLYNIIKEAGDIIDRKEDLIE